MPFSSYLDVCNLISIGMASPFVRRTPFEIFEDTDGEAIKRNRKGMGGDNKTNTHVIETFTALPPHSTLLNHLLKEGDSLDELRRDKTLFSFLSPSSADVRRCV